MKTEGGSSATLWMPAAIKIREEEGEESFVHPLVVFSSYGQNIEDQRSCEVFTQTAFCCHDKNEQISSRAVRPSPRGESEVFTGTSKMAPEIKQE